MQPAAPPPPQSPFEQGFSPYAPPAAGAVPPAVALPGAHVPLYKVGQVALAAFLGSALGGSVLIALNERRLGRNQDAVIAIVLGTLATIALLVVSFLLPDGVRLPVTGVTVGLAWRIANQRQGALLKAHEEAGGKIPSWWAATGIGLLCLVAILVPTMIVGAIAAIVSPESVK